MMDQVFSLAGAVALAGWIALAAAPLTGRWASGLRQMAGFGVPALLGTLYLALIASRWGGAPGGFGSLQEVRSLFSDDGLLLAGWIHYLAFDLFVGGWIARDGNKLGVPHWLLLPCFALTFLFGPVGFLLFLVVRMMRAPRAAASGSAGL